MESQKERACFPVLPRILSRQVTAVAVPRLDALACIHCVGGYPTNHLCGVSKWNVTKIMMEAVEPAQ